MFSGIGAFLNSTLRSSGLAFAVCVTALLVHGDIQAAVTVEQRQQIEALQVLVRDAGNLYKDGKFADSAIKISAVQEALTKLVESKDPAVLKLAKPVYGSVQRAHALLELEGAELKELLSWDQISGSAETGSTKPVVGTLSFKNDIAPIFAGQCANCHINNKRGQFSMVSFADLMRGSAGGVVLFPGNSKGSRLVEVIESGDMPRGSGKVTPENLNKLRKWIDEGAKFDGPDQQAPILSYLSAATNPTATTTTEVTASSGKESVKFSKDIAPILLENCNGCHIAGRRALGALSMDTFAQFVRGGDSGGPIAAGKPDESLLIKKLKGLSGNRMPAGGRAALSTEKIGLIATWIREGATFDGGNANLDIKAVAEQAWAATASHDELFARRQERAVERWRKVLPNVEPTIAKNSELVLLGNVTEARLQELLELTGEAIVATKRLLKVPAKESFLRGGMAIFVFKGTYEYSEFGRMTENRQLPNIWRAHWRSSPVEVYGAFVDESSAYQEQLSSLLLQITAGAYIGSFSQVPEWFADGIARNLVASTSGRKDPRVIAWQQSVPAAIQKVDNAQTLLGGKLDDEAAALIGMGLSSFMMDRANRKRFDTLLNILRSGQPFAQAVTATYAPPEQLIKTWLGKK